MSYLHVFASIQKSHHAVHLSNHLSLGSVYWTVTYESRLPRWGYQTEYTDSFALRSNLKLLEPDSCKKILAMSRCASATQARLLERYPKINNSILNKMEVLHPPQQSLIERYEDKTLPFDQIVFTIVGDEFYRKRGLLMIRAFSRLLKEGLPMKLNIVSRIQTTASGILDSEVRNMNRPIYTHRKNIKRIHIVNNEKVAQLLINSHAALLPTLEDTYGYAVLEAQACGCPVITTNVCALPEINSDELGWMIPLPLDDEYWNSTDYHQWAKGKENGSIKYCTDLIEESLVNIVKKAVDNPSVLQKKGVLALNRIHNEHDPELTSLQLEYIYNQALRDSSEPEEKTPKTEVS